MRRNIRIIAVEKQQRDVRLYVLALLRLARELQDAEEQDASRNPSRKEGER